MGALYSCAFALLLVTVYRHMLVVNMFPLVVFFVVHVGCCLPLDLDAGQVLRYLNRGALA